MKRIETPSNITRSPDKVVEDFIEARTDLVQSELAALSGGCLVRRYVRLVDLFLGELFLSLGLRQELSSRNGNGGMAILALGSYGNRELCLGSDLDLMVLHELPLPRKIERILLQMLYLLWDAKLEVGYTIVTPEESKRLIREDFGTLTSVMNSRLLLGSRSFYRGFMDSFFSDLQQDKEDLLKKIVLARRKREEKYGGEAYFIEPDIKEGPGGLRDFDIMRWVARACFGWERFTDIKRSPVFSHFEINKLNYSKGFLLKIRNLLHTMTAGKEDRLLLSHQEQLARLLSYSDSPYMSGPSRFMKDLYLHMNRIRYVSEEFLTKAMDVISPSSLDPVPPSFPAEFEVVKGNVVIKGGSPFRDDLILILKAFETANERDLFLGSGFIWEARRKITKEKRRLVEMPGAKEMFLNLIFDPRNPKIMRLALEIGLINAFIPEFRRIRNLAEFGYYHVETVDLHSLRTVEILYKIQSGAFDSEWPLLREVWNELKHPEWLFLAGLLHDIGKGYGKGHSVKGARKITRILKRLGLKGEVIKTITFLVRYHILLARISQRRDLGDEKTVVSVAQMIRDPDLLRMLFLLTVADSEATGPMARGEWKRLLLDELYFKVKKILEGGKLAAPDTRRKIAKKRAQALNLLKDQFPVKAIEALINQASTRYLMEVQVEDIVSHIRLALTMGEEPYAWALKKLQGVPVTRVIQCTYDRPGLFSKMVGVFALNNIRVLSANIFTLKNGLAFDVYEVTNPVDPYREKDRWEKVQREIILALEDRLPLEQLIREKQKGLLQSKSYIIPQRIKVKVDNEVSDFFTVIEVISLYRPGGLFEIAKQMYSLGLDIRFAKVNMDEEKMMGAFYVRDREGQKIYDGEMLRELKQGLAQGYGSGESYPTW